MSHVTEGKMTNSINKKCYSLFSDIRCWGFSLWLPHCFCLQKIEVVYLVEIAEVLFWWVHLFWGRGSSPGLDLWGGEGREGGDILVRRRNYIVWNGKLYKWWSIEASDLQSYVIWHDKRNTANSDTAEDGGLDNDIALYRLCLLFNSTVGFFQSRTTIFSTDIICGLFPLGPKTTVCSFLTENSPVTYQRPVNVQNKLHGVRWLYMVLFDPNGYCLWLSDCLTLALSPIAQSPARAPRWALGTYSTVCDRPLSLGLLGELTACPSAAVIPSSAINVPDMSKYELVLS